MPFEQESLYDFDALPMETKYRFAELELSYALTQCHAIFKHDPDVNKKAPRFLYELLIPLSQRSAQLESDFASLLRANMFRNPLKQELIVYFLYHQQSYTTIRAITNASPNTISKFKFRQTPYHPPIFTHWTPEYLYRWDTVKNSFNLFGLKQIQSTH